MAAECIYKELDRHLIDDGMMVEIMKELTSMLDLSSVTHVQVWA